MRLPILTAMAATLAACGPASNTNSSETAAKMKTVSIGTCTASVNAKYLPKDWTAKTLPELAKALADGDVTSEALVRDYLARIDALDSNGPRLQSILSVNPDALELAKAIDAKRANNEKLGPLAGVPVVLKDNIETKDNMPTTAGAVALANNLTERDSPLAAGLRVQGAIILGKTNLSQWANFRSNESVSGWTALGGQVRNPHMLDRTPCGSSSGTGAAIAASLAAGGVGTETNGSIICPANVNGVVGFKPTVGLVSQQYIVPISASQDTAGPMTKTVEGAAMMLSAMATSKGREAVDYRIFLDKNALAGKRIGVMRFSQGENADILEHFNAALADMEASGATLVDIDKFDMIDGFWPSTLPVLEYEFKHGLNAYLADTPSAVKPRSLTELIAFNETEPREMALFDQDLFEESDSLGDLTDTAYIDALEIAQRGTRAEGIDKMMAADNLDMLVSPSGPIAPRVDPVNGDVWPAWAGAGYIAAIAGYPHVTVPMGHVHGIPIGVSIMGGKGQDADILSFGYAYEQASLKRRDPNYLIDAEACSDVGAAMTVTR